MFLKIKAVARGIVYLCAPLIVLGLGLVYAVIMAGKYAAEFVRDYLEYFVTGEWFDDLRLRVFWPLRDFYFASVANRLIGILGALSLPGFILAHLLDGFRTEGGFQGFLVSFVDDLRDIRNAVVSGRAL